ncbi:MAG: hypothetical protein ACRCZK_02155 [Oscillospiraceae bacterium]
MEQKYIYIVLSQTVSIVGKTLRKLMKDEYTHASLSFDEQLNKMYSFSRIELEYPFMGAPANENLNKYFLGKENKQIKMKVLKIPVEDNQYKKIKKFVSKIFKDKEGYKYNCLEPLKIITNKPIECYKTYVCSSFVFDALKAGNLVDSSYKKSNGVVTPEYLGELFNNYLFYESEINKYKYFKASNNKIKRKKIKVIISPAKTMAFYTYTIYRHFKHTFNNQENTGKKSA